jgi:predicted GNAT family acetyltransferase
MQLIEVADAATFIKMTQDRFQAAEVESNMIFSSGISLAKSSSSRSSKVGFFVALDSAGNEKSKSDIARAALLHVRGSKALFWSDSDASAAFVGSDLRKRAFRIESLFGKANSISAFANTYSPGNQYQVQLRHMLMELDELKKPHLSPGTFRLATARDVPKLILWSRQFIQECKLNDDLAEAKKLVHRYFENEQLYIWETDRLVAMGAYGGFTPNGARLFMIYTDPSMRGHGFARSMTYRLTLNLQREGYEKCCLYTDVSNPISNGLYSSLGYTNVALFTDVEFA